MTAGERSAGRRALGYGAGAFAFWGLFPLLFDSMARLGAGPLEIVAWRTVFAAPFAFALVLATGRGRAALGLLRRPRTLLPLAASAGLIAVNWLTYVYAVTSGRTLSASLGYYINPLANLVLGAILFQERIGRTALAGVVLAALGVAAQAAALGAPPWISLVLAASFSGYGAVRKAADVDAQTGLLAECLILFTPALAAGIWLESSGAARFGHDPAASLLLFAAGPATVAPLAAFAYAARRLPLGVLGFLQFISPTLQFLCGLALGERLTPLSAGAFLLIWAGVGLFLASALKRGPEARALDDSGAEAALAELRPAAGDHSAA